MSTEDQLNKMTNAICLITQHLVDECDLNVTTGLLIQKLLGTGFVKPERVPKVGEKWVYKDFDSHFTITLIGCDGLAKGVFSDGSVCSNMELGDLKQFICETPWVTE